jgi:hypothetical protein
MARECFDGLLVPLGPVLVLALVLIVCVVLVLELWGMVEEVGWELKPVLEVPAVDEYTSSAHEFDAGDREDECVEFGLECVCEETGYKSEV